MKFLSGQLFDFLMCFTILVWSFVLILHFFKKFLCVHLVLQGPKSRTRSDMNDSEPLPYSESGNIADPFSMPAGSLFQ